MAVKSGALVRCRYQNFAGFRSQTSDFPHTFPLRGLEKISKRQQSFARRPRSGHTDAVLVRLPSRWPVTWKRSGARGCVRGPLGPACSQAPTCENHNVVCAAESTAARPFAKSACQITFTSAFCTCLWTHAGPSNIVSGMFLSTKPFLYEHFSPSVILHWKIDTCFTLYYKFPQVSRLKAICGKTGTFFHFITRCYRLEWWRPEN